LCVVTVCIVLRGEGRCSKRVSHDSIFFFGGGSRDQCRVEGNKAVTPSTDAALGGMVHIYIHVTMTSCHTTFGGGETEREEKKCNKWVMTSCYGADETLYLRFIYARCLLFRSVSRDKWSGHGMGYDVMLWYR
jgi:hypothetical protein